MPLLKNNFVFGKEHETKTFYNLLLPEASLKLHKHFVLFNSREEEEQRALLHRSPVRVIK